MDVTNAAPSVTFTLDAQATPVALHRFLQAQPGSGHVTIEFKLQRDTGSQKIPVMRVVHVGEREVLTDDSRQALMRKLSDWNDALLDKPGGSDAAKMLNGLVGTGNGLSFDVQELAPALAAMSDAHLAAHPNSYVKAWRENEQQVLDKAVSKEKGRAAEKIDEDERALRFALKVLSRFEDVDSMEIDGRAFQEQAWNIGHDLSPAEHGLLQIALMCLMNHKVSVEAIVGPEVVILLRLCRQAQGGTLSQFRRDAQTKQIVMQLMDALKKTGIAPSGMPDSPYAKTVGTRTIATSSPPVANNGANKTGKRHQRSGSMPATLLTKEPELTSPMTPEAENPVERRTKTTPPKSPRSGGLPASVGSQTVKLKPGIERPRLRRIRTDTEEAQPNGAAASSSSSALVAPRPTAAVPPSSTSPFGEKTELRKRRLERSGTAVQARREMDDDAPQPLGRDSHDKKKSTGKSSRSEKASKSGKSSKASNKESPPEGKDKATRSQPRKARRERSGDSALVAQQAAVSTSSTTTSGKAREELDGLPSHKPVQAPVYAPREDGPHYTEWGAFASDNQERMTEAVFYPTATLLSYLHEPPADVNALTSMVKGVLKTLRFPREKMLAVLQARDMLNEDKPALERYETLRQTRDLLSLVLKLDNERRIRKGLKPLYIEKAQ